MSHQFSPQNHQFTSKAYVFHHKRDLERRLGGIDNCIRKYSSDLSAASQTIHDWSESNDAQPIFQYEDLPTLAGKVVSLVAQRTMLMREIKWVEQTLETMPNSAEFLVAMGSRA